MTDIYIAVLYKTIESMNKHIQEKLNIGGIYYKRHEELKVFENDTLKTYLYVNANYTVERTCGRTFNSFFLLEGEYSHNAVNYVISRIRRK